MKPVSTSNTRRRANKLSNRYRRRPKDVNCTTAMDETRKSRKSTHMKLSSRTFSSHRLALQRSYFFRTAETSSSPTKLIPGFAARPFASNCLSNSPIILRKAASSHGYFLRTKSCASSSPAKTIHSHAPSQADGNDYHLYFLFFFLCSYVCHILLSIFQ